MKRKNDFKHDSSLEDTVRYDWSLARGSKEEKKLLNYYNLYKEND